MKKISIKKYIDRGALGRPEGEDLRKVLNDSWSKEKHFEIDLENRELAALSFFDEAFAQLVFDHPIEEIKAKISIKNAYELDRRLINSLIAKRLKEHSKTIIKKPLPKALHKQELRKAGRNK